MRLWLHIAVTTDIASCSCAVHVCFPGRIPACTCVSWLFSKALDVAIAHVHKDMQTSVESYTNHESMMLLCVTQPNALELVQKFMVQGLKEAVKEFSIADTSADVAALCAAAGTAAAAGDS
jgi:hypothetical protein